MHHRVALPDGVDILWLLVCLRVLVETVIKLASLVVSVGLAHVHPDVVLSWVKFPDLNIKVLSLNLIPLVLALISSSIVNFGGRDRSWRNNQETVLVILLVISAVLPIIELLFVGTLVIVLSLVAMRHIQEALIVKPALTCGQCLLIPLGELILLLVIRTLINWVVWRLKALIKALFKRASSHFVSLPVVRRVVIGGVSRLRMTDHLICDGVTLWRDVPTILVVAIASTQLAPV